MTATLPHDEVAERTLLGTMLTWPDAVAKASELVTAPDFIKPSHRGLFAVLVNLYGQGVTLDPVVVADAMRGSDDLDSLGGPAGLTSLQANAGSPSAAGRYCRIIANHAARRKLLSIAGELHNGARSEQEPADLVDEIVAALRAVDLPVTTVPPDLMRLDEFVAQVSAEEQPWLIEGLVRPGWRIVLVASEGAGKTYLLRQLAMSAAAGVHPLAHTPIAPVTTLVVDLENPADSIRDGARAVESALGSLRRVEGGCWIWHRPGGIDLRTRRDRQSFEAVLAHCRPQLVTLGPIYKSYQRKASETDEQVASEVQAAFDDLRTRYGFALIAEHHAPHGDWSGREMRPFGSSLWLRWPEIGLALKHPPKGAPLPKTSLLIERWRQDRVRNGWPARLERGKSWPWEPAK